MKIGIIGCGYVGQAIAKKWKQAGHFVSVTTRSPKRLTELEKVADQVFVLENQPMETFLAKQEVVAISVAPDSLESDYFSTYLATANSVVACLAKCPYLKQIIYTSSTSVYGNQEGNWVDETTPLASFNPYTAILAQTENVLLEQSSSQLKVCVFRLGEIYGPGREIESRLQQSYSRPFPGTGDNYTNLIHLEDIVQALDFAVQQALSGIYNLCNDDHIPRKELYQILCQRFHLSPVQWDPAVKSRHAGNKRIYNQKLKELGFSFSHSLLKDPLLIR